MDKLIVTNLPPYDGEYEFENLEFTFGELHKIKQMTGLRRGDFMDAVVSRDADLDIAFSLVVLERHGHTADPKILWAATPGSLTLVFGDDDEADDAAPLAKNESLSGGDSSNPASDNQENDQSPTGDQHSGTSATSAPGTSES